mgnify:CR=1 FL=1
MKIELLYCDDCPNWQAVLEEINGLLAAKSGEDKVDLILVSSIQEAERLQFPGSPTVRINGEDVDPEVPSSSFEMACRVYEVDGKLTGRPPMEWIYAALDDAAE